mgnify:CR=1 FL=1
MITFSKNFIITPGDRLTWNLFQHRSMPHTMQLIPPATHAKRKPFGVSAALAASDDVLKIPSPITNADNDHRQ